MDFLFQLLIEFGVILAGPSSGEVFLGGLLSGVLYSLVAWGSY